MNLIKTGEIFNIEDLYKNTVISGTVNKGNDGINLSIYSESMNAQFNKVDKCYIGINCPEEERIDFTAYFNTLIDAVVSALADKEVA